MNVCPVFAKKGGNSSWLKSNSRSILATKSQVLLISDCQKDLVKIALNNIQNRKKNKKN